MTERSEKRRAIAAAGPFEATSRARAVLSGEAIAGAVALIAAFMLMTGIVLHRVLG